MKKVYPEYQEQGKSEAAGEQIIGVYAYTSTSMCCWKWAFGAC
jgi:hypothetical protein